MKISIQHLLLFFCICFSYSSLIVSGLFMKRHVSMQHHHIRREALFASESPSIIEESFNYSAPAAAVESLSSQYLNDKNELLFDLFMKASNLTAAAEQYVNFCDEDFNNHLNLIIKAAPSELEKVQLGKIRYEINKARQRKLREADTLLREILSAGPLNQMEAKLQLHLRRGDIDMAFMVILQVNLEDAMRANADTAIQVMLHLQKIINEHQDGMVTPPVRLMRLLVRIDDEETRKQLLRQKLLIGRNLKEKEQAEAEGREVNAQQTPTAQCEHIVIDPVKEWGPPDVQVQELYDTIADVQTQMASVGSEPDDIAYFQEKCASIRKEIELIVDEMANT